MIGLIDSGIGGLTVLRKCLDKFPNNKFIYLADNKNLPFGNKSKKKLIEIAKTDSKILINLGCDIIVFACNTLTAAAIKSCRAFFPKVNFIGIEPAIMPAIRSKQKTLVLLTKATYKFSGLIQSHKHDKNLFFYPQRTLAKDIENGKLKAFKKYFKKNNYGAVVLGCTHYNLIKQDLKNYLGVNNFFEASNGVVSRIEKFASNTDVQSINFIFTGEEEYEKYLKILEEKKPSGF